MVGRERERNRDRQNERKRERSTADDSQFGCEVKRYTCSFLLSTNHRNGEKNGTGNKDKTSSKRNFLTEIETEREDDGDDE